MKKLILLAALLGACSADSTTAPRVMPTTARHNITCRSGYIIAYDENGNAYCAPSGGMMKMQLDTTTVR